MKLINGRALAEKIKDTIAVETFNFSKVESSWRPNLAIILVGEREDSKLYVSLKEREGKKVGIDTSTYRFAENCSEEELLESIIFFNSDPDIDGIILQLPLPKHLKADKIISKINPKKDVDGFNPGRPKNLLSPVLLGVLEVLKSEKFSYQDKKIVLFGNSQAFIQTFKEYFPQIEFVSSLEELKTVGPQADILISAVGQAEVIKANMVKDGSFLVDIGISKVNDKVKGDFDLESVKDKAKYLTPVPGGIGPLTVAFLLQNVLTAYKNEKQV